MLPIYFQSIKFIQGNECHDYPKTRTKLAEKSIRCTIPKLVNDTTPVVLDKIFTHSLQGFSFYIKFKTNFIDTFREVKPETEETLDQFVIRLKDYLAKC